MNIFCAMSVIKKLFIAAACGATGGTGIIIGIGGGTGGGGGGVRALFGLAPALLLFLLFEFAFETPPLKL